MPPAASPVAGIHHVTAIAADPQVNHDFHVQVLGLRLVKATVNFDDPGTWHLYFGDGAGRPGTILTYFPHPRAKPGEPGLGQVVATAFAVPAASLDWWASRLDAHEVPVERDHRFAVDVLTFGDRHGTRLELVGDDEACSRWERAGAGAGVGAGAGAGATSTTAAGNIPSAHAIRGFHSVTLAVGGFEATAGVLAGVLGLVAVGAEGDRHRFRCAGDGPAVLCDVRCLPAAAPGRLGAGAVHHVAWRAADDDHHAALRTAVVAAGLDVTPVLDRSYFRSIYFREPGGVIFEIATDTPGFATDEAADALGTALMLPAQHEPLRDRLIQRLPAIRLAGGGTIPG